MAEHDDAAQKTESLDPDVDSTAEELDAQDFDAESAVDDAAPDETTTNTKRRVPQWLLRTPTPITVGVAAIVALLGVGGWLGFRLHQDHQVRDQRSLYVQVARQTAINLTTINYAEVDADIKRVLDSATGGFHDEFQNRSQPFVEVVKKVQSKTEGTIAEAGLLSYTKEQAQVLVAVSVKTSMGTAPADQEPRRWRMRLTVDKVGDGAKVSNVEFVP
ncbi:Mce protein [Mycobacterium paraterrae]|uniref:Mce protein n=1 Tax=Mycobacterium paraterrae TaxID=577492 RepID=A0ABY3VV71_9MYCO|nr:Mce protein [Mycobacterium paraterrae]UMB71395.1 Mce protein [Mycobacterium paraterrae]